MTLQRRLARLEARQPSAREPLLLFMVAVHRDDEGVLVKRIFMADAITFDRPAVRLLRETDESEAAFCARAEAAMNGDAHAA